MQGLLLLNKPQNITSFGAVAAVRRIAGEKRVGHTGTLDPMATGVLPVFLGRATALSSYLLDSDKRYTAVIRLGTVTDTGDITGTVLEQNTVTADNNALQTAVVSFTGKQKQRPPMFSALKKDGVRLYKLAREGKTVDIPERDIEIFSIDIISPLDTGNEFKIDVHVSKGTYIRSLAEDIGRALGCGATLSGLCRTVASGFELPDCVTLDELNTDNIGEHIKSEERAVARFRELEVTEKQAVRFCNGGQLGFERLKTSRFENGELFRVKFNGQFLGLGAADCEKEQISVKCVINYLSDRE